MSINQNKPYDTTHGPWCTCRRDHVCHYLGLLATMMLRNRAIKAVEMGQWKKKQDRIRLIAMMICSHRLRAYREGNPNILVNATTYAFADDSVFKHIEAQRLALDYNER